MGAGSRHVLLTPTRATRAILLQLTLEAPRQAVHIPHLGSKGNMQAPAGATQKFLKYMRKGRQVGHILGERIYRNQSNDHIVQLYDMLRVKDA